MSARRYLGYAELIVSAVTITACATACTSETKQDGLGESGGSSNLGEAAAGAEADAVSDGIVQAYLPKCDAMMAGLYGINVLYVREGMLRKLSSRSIKLQHYQGCYESYTAYPLGIL